MRHLMNPATGSVDTEDNWLAEIREQRDEVAAAFPDEDPDQMLRRQFDSLVEVRRQGNEWVEA